MKILISPAKKLDTNCAFPGQIKCSLPKFLDHSNKIIKELKKLSIEAIANLMNVSAKIAELNFNRYEAYDFSYENNINLAPAIYAFKGDVYQQLDIVAYNQAQLDYTENNLLILSGLFGFLKPFDLLYPYRLEMGTNTKEIMGKNLHTFWQNILTEELNRMEDDFIINLASQEYSSAIQFEQLTKPVLNINFMENREGKLKIIGINAKRARGQYLNWLIKNQINKKQDLREFTLNNYKLNYELSNENNLIFTQ